MDEDPNVISDSVAAGIGRVVRCWADLENTLHNWVSYLLGVDQFRGRLIWASMPNFRARRTFLLRLAETFLDDTTLPEFRALLKRAKALSQNRNMLAHESILTNPLNPDNLL